MSLFAVDGIEPPIPSREITNTAGVDISPEHAWSRFLNTIIVSLLKVLLGQQAMSSMQFHYCYSFHIDVAV